jgi:hypothetical protein
MAKSMEYCKFANPTALASQISNSYVQWKTARSKWEEEKKEVREYVFARDTSTTSNNSLPWKNKTTTPKLCQIRDNLHANYMAAMFSREDWFDWLPGDQSAATKAKATAITTYMKAKLRASDFRAEVSKLVFDYIDFGNAIAEVQHERRFHELPDKTKVKIYVGPKLQRISPYDIVFDLSAPTFEEAAKITRRTYSLGDLKKMALDGQSWAQAAFDSATAIRRSYFQAGQPDLKKFDSYPLDGLGNLNNYFSGSMVDILEFEGDAFDPETGTLYPGHKILVVDRREIAYKAPYESWLGRSNKKHIGWRPRPESLMAMGPLDNLVGMQYRVDHLENLKADIFDQIAHPVVYQRGTVEDWEWGPGARIFGDEKSSVELLRPDSVALNANFEIANLLNLMEEMAGAPKQAMGIRTPGEKTAYEVQVLENAAGRIFQNKTFHFESQFIEPLLNDMLEAARRNMDTTEQIAVQDTDIGVVEFQTVTAEDIKANGKLVPMGSRHFSEVASQVQNINAFLSSPAYADQVVAANISGLAIANQLGELLKFPKGTVVPGIRIMEQANLAKLSQAAQSTVQDDALAGQQLAQADAEVPEEAPVEDEEAVV